MMLPALMALASGCQDDERVARERVAREQVIRESVASQREQNRRMDEQNRRLIETSHEVTRQGRELAQTAERLVEQDARARQEMIVAHQAMREQLHEERTSVDQQRAVLEQDRKTVARQRLLLPVIADSIEAIGLLLAAMLPLALAYLVLHASHRQSDEAAAVSEMLVLELTTRSPRWLSCNSNPPALPTCDVQAALMAPQEDHEEGVSDPPDPAA